MKTTTPFRLGDVAAVVSDLDYRALFEEEVRKRRSAEGRLGAAQAKISSLTGSAQGLAAAVERGKRFQHALDDVRRAMAGRLMAAAIIREGLPEGEAALDMAEKVAHATDALVDMLLATKRSPL